MTEPIPHEKVVETLKAIVARNPEQTNPVMSDGDVACLYTYEDQHCIAGQVLVDLGLDLTPVINRGYNGKMVKFVLDEFFPTLFTTGSVALLTVAQYQADKFGTPSWGSVLTKLEEKDLV